MAEGKRADPPPQGLHHRIITPQWQHISSESDVKRLIAHQPSKELPRPQQQQQQQQQQQSKKFGGAAPTSTSTATTALPEVVLAVVFNGDALSNQSLTHVESVIGEAVAAVQQKQPARGEEEGGGDSKKSAPPLPSIDLTFIKPAFIEWKVSRSVPFGNHLAKALLDYSVASDDTSSRVVVAAILRGELLDKVSFDLIADNETVLSSDRARRNQRSEKASASLEEQEELTRTFVAKFLRHCFGKLRGAPTTGKLSEQQGSALAVDINKMIHMGKELLGKRSPQYAEKFFSRAVETLEALVVESVKRLREENKNETNNNNNDDDVDVTVGIADLEAELVASLAESLAWRILARFVCNSASAPTRQGVLGDGARLQAILSVHQTASAMAREYTGIVLRAEALARMTQALSRAPTVVLDKKDGENSETQQPPLAWIESECSEGKLRKKLEQDPKDNDARSLLIITLFLAGDMERCLTEAIKLATLSVPFGSVAVSAVTHFLGPDNELIKKL